ncbi:hypothetical protein JHK86_006482 [Glycine max]|nr:hypothetical protein JHK86_006482 [Glycine max]
MPPLLIVLYVVFKLDESYMPSKVSIRVGDGFHNMKEIKTVELVKPTGWVYLSLSGADPRPLMARTGVPTGEVVGDDKPRTVVDGSWDGCGEDKSRIGVEGEQMNRWETELTRYECYGMNAIVRLIELIKVSAHELIVLYVVFKLDESYMPSKVSIRVGDGFHNMKEIKTVELVKPTGWVYLSLSGADPR